MLPWLSPSETEMSTPFFASVSTRSGSLGSTTVARRLAGARGVSRAAGAPAGRAKGLAASSPHAPVHSSQLQRAAVLGETHALHLALADG